MQHNTSGILINLLVFTILISGCGKKSGEPGVSEPPVKTQKKELKLDIAPPVEPVKQKQAVQKPLPAKQAKQAEKTEPATKTADLPKPTNLQAALPSIIRIKVNDTAITQADIDKKLSEFTTLMAKKGISDEQLSSILPRLEEQIIDALITEALINDKCKRQKITVSEQEVQKEIGKFKATLPKSVVLSEFLAQRGLSDKMFRTEIKDQLKIEKLLNIVEPSEKEIENYYKNNKEQFEIPDMILVRHILIATNQNDSSEVIAEKKKKIENLRQEILKGADFAKLAEANSDCPSSKKGGMLPLFGRGQMIPEFEKVAFNLKTNETSKVVQTQFGYHIIQTLEHHEGKTPEFSEIKKHIPSIIKASQIQKQIYPVLKELRDKATIVDMRKK